MAITLQKQLFALFQNLRLWRHTLKPREVKPRENPQIKCQHTPPASGSGSGPAGRIRQV